MQKTLLLAALTGALCAAGCRSRVPGYERDWYAGVAFSAIPGVGLSVDGGKVIKQAEKHDWSAEAEFIWQPLNDADLADDGFAGSSTVTAVRAGFKHSFSPGHKRHLTARYGFQYYRATGTPGIINAPGNYYGAYASIGFETDLSPHWTMGPELSAAFLQGEGDLHGAVIPTFFWRLIYNF